MMIYVSENVSTKNLRTCSHVRVRDYSDYDSELCHDGGRYATGVDFYRHEDGWERQEYTSGDYCPYCGSFDCCGSCEEAFAAEAERLTEGEVFEEVLKASEAPQTEITFEEGDPLTGYLWAV